jgi:hypothetical protein
LLLTERILAYARRVTATESTILALFLISLALQLNDGHLSRPALALATAGLACCIWGFVSNDRGLRWQLPLFVLAGELLCLLIAQPTVGMPPHSLAFRSGILFCAVCALVVCTARQELWRHLAFGAAVAAMFVIGVWILRTTPIPPIDVYDLHQEASAALFSGKNPYEIRVRDIYTPSESAYFYGPGLSVNGRLTVGFPYPPISLFLSSLGYLVAGDCRYAHLACICLAAVLFAYARPGRLSFLAALLFLFTPRVFYVLEQDWSEATSVFLLGVFVFCRCRFPAIAPWITGLLLTAKQYMIFTTPALLRKWRDVPKAVLAGAVVNVPLALWNVYEFYRSTVFFHFRQPVRLDALSYMGQLGRYHIHLPGWVPFVLTGAAMLIVIRLAPSTTSAMCSTTAFILIVFFIFNKAAFCNYYFLVLAALAGAIAVAEKAPAAGAEA